MTIFDRWGDATRLCVCTCVRACVERIEKSVRVLRVLIQSFICRPARPSLTGKELSPKSSASADKVRAPQSFLPFYVYMCVACAFPVMYVACVRHFMCIWHVYVVLCVVGMCIENFFGALISTARDHQGHTLVRLTVGAH